MFSQNMDMPHDEYSPYLNRFGTDNDIISLKCLYNLKSWHENYAIERDCKKFNVVQNFKQILEVQICNK